MQIANTLVRLLETGTTDTTLLPVFARKGEARWEQGSLPEIGRVTCVYTRRDPTKDSPLVKHSFRFTVPTLKSIVTDPSGPYAPTPVVDYVTVCELNCWTHPRATEAEREAAFAPILNDTATVKALLDDVVKSGNALY